jgi:hypothetical protein
VDGAGNSVEVIGYGADDMDPEEGPVGGGAILTFSGLFPSDISSVTVGGIPCTDIKNIRGVFLSCLTGASSAPVENAAIVIQPSTGPKLRTTFDDGDEFLYTYYVPEAEESGAQASKPNFVAVLLTVAALCATIIDRISRN